MTTQGKVVFFDLETAGLEPGVHPIIQFAGIAVESATLRELDSIDVRVKLYRSDEWQPKALAGNCFAHHTGFAVVEGESQDALAERFADFAHKWNESAQERTDAFKKIDLWLRSHASVPMKSQRGKTYYVTRLAGHNVGSFDIPHLRAAYGSGFFPCEYRCLDTYHLAAWVRWMDSGVANLPINLQALADWLGVKRRGEAHDALSDVRLTLDVCHRLMFKLTCFRRTGATEKS